MELENGFSSYDMGARDREERFVYKKETVSLHSG